MMLATMQLMALEEHADWALSYYEPMLVETSSHDLFFLTCLGMDPAKRPADDWLSIAETHEFLRLPAFRLAFEVTPRDTAGL